MAEHFKIAEDDPDLEAFERLIADYHPWYRRFKKKAENRPSYKHKNFSYRAFEQGPLPGNEDPYCPFAFSFFNIVHVHNYLYDCHVFLETPYGRKKDKGIQKLKDSFELLANDENSEAMRSLKLIAEAACAIWLGLIRDYVVDKRNYINDDLQGCIIAECEKVSDDLWELAKSDEFDVGELKTLGTDAKYALLANLLLQEYKRLVRIRAPQLIELWLLDIVRVKQASTNKRVNVKVPEEYEKKLSRYIDVVLAHHLVKKLSSKPQMPSSPADFIFKEISKNKFAKSRDLRAQYRWLFIKAWLYSYLRKYNLTLSEVAEQISRDDDFFYMSDMPKLADFEKQVHKDEIQQARFLDLKNNFSAWKNNKSKDGYIHSQILASSKDQA
ncbi:TPA: hypothetical protein I7296_16485 [Vibrio parahaemolyticus]|nr:hypothetical protein [Vibrio parahaemolyticus]